MNLEELRNRVTEGALRIEGHKALLRRLQTSTQAAMVAEAETQLARLIAEQEHLVAAFNALRDGTSGSR